MILVRRGSHALRNVVAIGGLNRSSRAFMAIDVVYGGHIMNRD